MSQTSSEVTKKTDVKRKFKFALACKTDVGRRRSENQDSYSFAHSKNCSLFVVADGMGGSRGGRTASTITVNVVAALAFNSDGVITESLLSRAIEAANTAVHEESKGNPSLAGMGTTIVALGFVGDRVLVAHVGDSRIYQFCDGKFERLTRDHSLVQDLIDSGTINEAEAENHPIAHMLTRSLGPTDSVEVEIRYASLPVKPNTRFLLCSDGLYNHVKDEEIEQMLGSLEPDVAASKLLDLALERGGTDNITIQIIRTHELDDDDDTCAIPVGDDREVVVSEEYELDHLSLTNGFVDNEAIPSVEEPEPATTQNFQEEVAENIPVENNDIGLEKYIFLSVIALTFGVLSWVGYERLSLSPSATQVALNNKIEVAVPVGEVISDEELITWKPEEGKKDEIPTKTQVVEDLPPTTEEPVEEPIGEPLEEEILKETSEPEPEPEPAWPTIEVAKVEDTLTEPTESAVPTIDSPEVMVGELVSTVRASVSEVDSTTEKTVANDTVIDEAVLRSLFNLSVGEPPKVNLVKEQKAATEIINWKSEKKELKKVVEDKTKSEPNNLPAIVITEEEKLNVASEKLEIRESVFDLDIKLHVLSGIDIEKEKKSLEIQLAEFDAQAVILKNKQEVIGKSYKEWTKREKQLETKKALQLAEELINEDKEFASTYKAYEKALYDYFDADKRWQENEDDDKLASVVAKKNRDLRAKRLNVEKDTVALINSKVESSRESYSALGAATFFLQIHRDRINRTLGFFHGWKPNIISDSKTNRVKTLLEERNKLVTELDTLKRKLSDSEEITFRKSKFLDEL